MAEKLDEKALAPCPFCGGEAAIRSNKDSGNAWGECTACMAQGGGFQDVDMPEHLLREHAAREWNRRALPAPSGAKAVADEQIEHMVQRFLGWKLPDSFSPDAGISFEPVVNAGTKFEFKHEPVGTNLFDHKEATAMVRHMVEEMPALAHPLPAEVGRVLEPFAKAADFHCAPGNVDSKITEHLRSSDGTESILRVGDFRAARDLLSKTGRTV